MGFKYNFTMRSFRIFFALEEGMTSTFNSSILHLEWLKIFKIFKIKYIFALTRSVVRHNPLVKEIFVCSPRIL